MIISKIKIERKIINNVLYERLNQDCSFNSVNKEICEVCGNIETLFEMNYNNENLYLCGNCIRDIKNPIIDRFMYMRAKENELNLRITLFSAIYKLQDKYISL